MQFINTRIIASPLNWVIIFLMLVFALAIADVFMQLAGQHHSCTCQSPND